MTGGQGVLQEGVDVVRGGVAAADPGLDSLEEDVGGVDVRLEVGVLGVGDGAVRFRGIHGREAGVHLELVLVAAPSPGAHHDQREVGVHHVLLLGDVLGGGQAAAELGDVLQAGHRQRAGYERQPVRTTARPLRKVPLGEDALAVVVAADALPEVVLVGVHETAFLPALQPGEDLGVLQVPTLGRSVLGDFVDVEHGAGAVQDGHLLLDEGREEAVPAYEVGADVRVVVVGAGRPVVVGAQALGVQVGGPLLGRDAAGLRQGCEVPFADLVGEAVAFARDGSDFIHTKLLCIACFVRRRSRCSG